MPDTFSVAVSVVRVAFAVLGAPLDRDVLVSETAVDWRVSDALTLTAAYSGQLSSRASEHGLKGQLLVKF